jgi:hypothetical protein
MPVRRPLQRHSFRTRPIDPCSHTREVTDHFVVLFYFSFVSRKKTCPKRRPQTSAISDADLLRASRLT